MSKSSTQMEGSHRDRTMASAKGEHAVHISSWSGTRGGRLETALGASSWSWTGLPPPTTF